MDTYLLSIILLTIPVGLFLINMLHTALTPAIMKKKPKLPTFGYELIYCDHNSGKASGRAERSKLLVSHTYGITGKPDLIYKGNGRYLPVELKSGSINDTAVPHNGDLMQLTAYFLIIEDVYGTRPKYGRLIYNDYMFVVRNTRGLRKQLQRILRQMRELLTADRIDPNEQSCASFAKCRYCICRGTVCELYEENNNIVTTKQT